MDNKVVEIKTEELMQIKRAVELFNEGKRDSEVKRELEEELGIKIRKNSKILSEAKKHFIMALEIPTKEYYMKESLMEYDEIKERADDVRDLKEGLKIKLGALRDRNELIGLAKAGVNIEINFNSKNLSDAEFLDAMNVEVKPEIIDIPLEKKDE
jgi:hypothetical protein